MVSLVRILSCMAVAVLVVFSTPRVNADIMGFQGIYAPGNWSQVIPPTAAITTSPTIVSLTSGDDPMNVGQATTTTFSILITVSGTISFDWLYASSNSDATFDPFGYFVNTNETQLTDDVGGVNQGPFTAGPIAVMAGDTFGFYQRTIDNEDGAATTRISGFSGPGQLAAVPEPATASLLGIAVLTGAFWQFFKRRRLATTA